MGRSCEQVRGRAENAVQIHLNAQSNRTNDIMRTLTVLTAIFLSLNLIALGLASSSGANNISPGPAGASVLLFQINQPARRRKARRGD